MARQQLQGLRDTNPVMGQPLKGSPTAADSHATRGCWARAHRRIVAAPNAPNQQRSGGVVKMRGEGDTEKVTTPKVTA